MKASDLSKDAVFSGRINGEIKEMLKNRGISIQKIIDDYINENIKVEISEVGNDNNNGTNDN